jgi:hypothetical protein
MKPFIKYLFAFAIIVSSCSRKAEQDVLNDDDHTDDVHLLVPPRPFSAPKNDDEYFFNYRLENFAPDTEPLIHETFGSQTIIEQAGFWEHSSYTSCAIGFSTSLPTLSTIEYGETEQYGQTVEQSDSYYYCHLHRIRDLESGKTYNYRIVVRGYDGKQTVSGNHTFTTRRLSPEIIRIPEDFKGDAPYTITQGNAKYVLTRDLTVPALAINIKASNVELDLDGHTIIYDDGAPDIVGSSWNEYAYDEKATFGIRAGLWNFANIKVLNGAIVQGRNGGAGFIGIGFNPLFLNHMLNSYNEVAGITVDYYGNSVGGMVTGDGHIHHNVLYDRGSVIDDRHMAVRAINAGSNLDNNVSYNSLRRFRHRGIDNSGITEHNELYSDSFDTNSFAIGAGNGARITGNRIFGMGYLPIGIGWGNNMRVTGNFIYMRGYAPTKRSQEYDRKSSVAGMRVTNYDNIPMENMLFEDNVIVLKAEDGCTMARGIWTTNGVTDKNIVYRRNTVKVEAMPGNLSNPEGAATGAYYNGDVNYVLSAVTFSGGMVNREGDTISDPIIFEDNHLTGNVNLVTIGEGYGICNSVWMYRTRIEKIGHDSEFFRPVRLGFWYWDTWNNRMTDTECIGFDENEMTPYFYGGTGKMEMYYGESKTLTVTDSKSAPLSNRQITVSTDEDGYTQTLATDANGKLTFDLLTVRHFKYGDSQDGGIRGTPTETEYQRYVFNVAGYKPYSIATEQLRNSKQITINN